MSDDVGFRAPRPRPVVMTALIGLLALEAIAVTGVAVFLLIELLTEPASSLAGGVAIVVIAFLAAAWLIAMVVGAIRRRPWIRAAGVTWQLIQVSIAVGCFQGIFARPDLGWLLLVPALVTFILLISPAVTAALQEE